MALEEGVDFSFGRPGGAAIVQAGKKFVIRYITGVGSKALTELEVKDYHTHGLDIALVFENTTGRVLGGHDAGQSDARAASNAMTALGVPSYVPIYFAVDFDIQPNQYLAVDAYLQGAASILGSKRVGVYGHYHIINHCASVKSAAWFWQTYAWSSGSIFSATHLLQYSNGHSINGSAVDYDHAYQTNFGQWPAKIIPPPVTVNLRFGGVQLTPPQNKVVNVPAGIYANVRTRPTNAAPIVLRIKRTGVFKAYQVTHSGQLLAGSKIWYGNAAGIEWLHSSAF